MLENTLDYKFLLENWMVLFSVKHPKSKENSLPSSIIWVWFSKFFQTITRKFHSLPIVSITKFIKSLLSFFGVYSKKLYLQKQLAGQEL